MKKDYERKNLVKHAKKLKNKIKTVKKLLVNVYILIIFFNTL